MSIIVVSLECCYGNSPFTIVVLHKAIYTIYTSVKYCIKLNDGLTRPIERSKGLTQGDVLSPLLFNLFFNDLKDVFDDGTESIDLHNIELSHLLYADDLILMSWSKEGLQVCLGKLANYCDKWNLKVNMENSKTLVFNPGSRNFNDHEFYFNDNELESVKEFTYLGIDFTLNGSFSSAVNTLKDKANKAIPPLIDTVFKFEMTYKQATNLFSSLIKPILLYGSEIWGSLSAHQLKVVNNDTTQLGNYILTSNVERSQLKFCKQILGLKRNCPSLAVLGELSLSPITLTGFIRLIKFWHRLTQMDEECLANRALRTTENSLGELSCWYATVKTLLKLIGFTDLWKHPSRYSTNRVHALFKRNSIFSSNSFGNVNSVMLTMTVSEIRNYDPISYLKMSLRWNHMQQVKCLST